MWLRLYVDTRDDPKVQRLPGETFKQWINLLCLAKEHGGLLPPVEDIAFKLRITEADARSLVEELAERKLLDITDEGLSPHNWDERQFLSDSDPTAAVRSRRYRQRNVTRDATSDDTDASRPASRTPETESETEQNQRQKQSRGGSGENPSPAASRAKRAAARRPNQCDEEYFAELQRNPAYESLDVRALYHKMVAWCQVKGKQPTRGRLVNWLNREDKPMTAKTSPPKTGDAYVGKQQPKANGAEDQPVSDATMAEFIDELIDADDFAGIGEQYDLIAKRGGAKAEWEVRVVAYYELHASEPATPEQVATLKRQISELANRS